MKSINRYTKIEAGLIHLLPFKPSVKREKGFSIQRTFGNRTMTLNSFELLNVVDLIVFTQIINIYNTDPNQWHDAGTANGKPVIKHTLDLKALTNERIGNSDKRNRQITAECLERMSNVKVAIKHKDTNSITHAWYIHEVKFDVDFKDIEIFVNEAFFKKCADNGLVFNYGRLLNYGKNYYAVLLDAYLQGTKDTSKGFSYRQTYKQDDLFEVLYLNETNMCELDKHKIIKKSFQTLEKIGKLPKYEYEKFTSKWMRSDYLKKQMFVA